MAPGLRTVNQRRRCVRHLPIQQLKRREPCRTVPRRVVCELHCSPASSPSIAGVHANTPPRWERRRCLPATIYSIRRRAAPLGGGRSHWMSPPGCQGREWRRCLPTTIYTRARLRAPPRPASVIRETLRSWASAPDVAPRTLRS
jgi:hypothetical protein